VISRLPLVSIQYSGQNKLPVFWAHNFDMTSLNSFKGAAQIFAYDVSFQFWLVASKNTGQVYFPHYFEKRWSMVACNAWGSIIMPIHYFAASSLSAAIAKMPDPQPKIHETVWSFNVCLDQAIVKPNMWLGEVPGSQKAAGIELYIDGIRSGASASLGKSISVYRNCIWDENLTHRTLAPNLCLLLGHDHAANLCPNALAFSKTL